MIPEDIRRPQPGALVEVGAPAAALASATAPIIFADIAGTWGISDNVVGFSFEAIRHTSHGDEVVTDSVTVLHLRMSLKGARQLRDVINKVELMAAKQEGAAN